MMTTSRWILSAVAAAAFTLAGCEATNMQMGSPGAKTVATGGAAGSHARGESAALEYCDAPLGTVSLVENQHAGWYTILRNEYRLPPTANLLRLLVQQSNCFVVVERSAAGMGAMSRERQLMQSGEMRAGSNFGKGQMVASDYAMSPEIVFSSNDAGGIGGVLGGLIGGGRGRAVAAVGGGLKTREAAALLTLVDNRSGVQVAAAEGSAAKADMNLFGGVLGGRAGAGLGGYTNTPEGKVIAAAFMDAYNQMVASLRGYSAQRVPGQGLGGGGRLGVDGGAAPSQTYAPGQGGVAMSVVDAQRRLNQLGYNVGTPDGAIGPRTVQGLRTFQQDNNLPATGRLDAHTREALAGY